METTRKRRWWQFGLKAILYVTLVVAAYFAGRSHQAARRIELEGELAGARKNEAHWKNMAEKELPDLVWELRRDLMVSEENAERLQKELTDWREKHSRRQPDTTP